MSDRLPLSAIVLTFNEERNLGACLESLAGWAGEIYVVDSGSTDGTLALARRYTDTIEHHPFDTYGLQRNWAQEHLALAYPWVLHIDADERVSPELQQSIRAFFVEGRAERYSGAMFPRRTIFMGRWIRHGGHYPVYQTRLFLRARGRCEDRLYDQHFIVDGPVARLDGDLIDVLTPDLDTWTLRHVRWAGAEARELAGSGDTAGTQVRANLFGSAQERRRWLRSILFKRSPRFLRAFLYFAYRYILRRGFLDGTEGLIYHVLHGFWFRFYTDARLWEIERGDRAPLPHQKNS
jgi:glycosyltransferase involved in cell wall biosynthesis